MSKRHTHTVQRGKLEAGCPRCIELAKALAALDEVGGWWWCAWNLVVDTSSGLTAGQRFEQSQHERERRIALAVDEAWRTATHGRFLHGTAPVIDIDEIIKGVK